MTEPESDLDLVRRIKTDPAAFGILYERYIIRLYNYVYYRTGDHHDAEDLTSRVFYRALMHIEEYVDRGVPFSAWLYRIAHNLVANWHRDHARRQDLNLEDAVLIGGGQPHATSYTPGTLVNFLIEPESEVGRWLWRL